MSKPILVDTFYGQVSNFLGELCRVFPYDPDFPSYRTQFQLLRKTNPTLPLKQLGLHAPALLPLLSARSADTFMTCDVPPGLESLVQKLRGYWSYMAPENQAVVWSYLELLTALASRYTA